MGKILCTLWQSEEVRILIFGLNAAGKTISLYRLKLAIANKQDLPNATTVEEIETKIKEKKIIQTQTWKVFPAVATTGDGLYEALNWLNDQLALKKTRGYLRNNENDTTTVKKDQKSVQNFNSKFEHFKESLLNVKSLIW
ncbi:hypothetical protein CHS0354_011724 [Potamilus streckersoni]|uniref:Uncharacterized protein n=1 Tax=Potamilus streckersoni TaxID=2493646 RepID=A0AAE0SJL8_9BIVA|nr:hypothetical protein CHS0354_011724 [Potamilus streckersoni]